MGTGGSGTCSEPLTRWDLAAHTGSFWGHLFSSFWFGSPPSPHRGIPSNEKWQELWVQWSQSPQGLRTPGRHWSLVALGGLLPFPLKEAAAPAAQEDHKSACSCHAACLPVDCTHPQGRPPSTCAAHTEAVGSVCRESRRKPLLYCKPYHRRAAGRAGLRQAFLKG